MTVIVSMLQLAPDTIQLGSVFCQTVPGRVCVCVFQGGAGVQVARVGAGEL